jgi:triacylglycerol esterase/lipase EstA (alpha/beta hydrolase family)
MRRSLLVLGVLVALLAPAASASAQDPILFVHGWSGNASNWSVMIAQFQADGYPASHLRAFTYNSAQSNVTTAGVVANQVNQLKAATGAAKVDIVTHSMGGLSSRYYLRNLGGTANVDDWVSIGGPNHGTSTALACSLLVSCREMLPGSAFLTALNSGDETPGTTNYGTFWSPCDEIINPDTSTILSGATNVQTGCIGHLSLLVAPSVYEGVRDFVQ